MSYDDQSSETSFVGLPGRGELTPFAKGNWLIRCKVENREWESCERNNSRDK